MGCGTKIQMSDVGTGFSKLVHSLALECRDYKMIFSTFYETWKLLMSTLGKFLGFTYLDDKQQQRAFFVDRIEVLKKDIEALEANRDVDFETYSDPNYFLSFDKRIKEMDSLIYDIMKTDSNFVAFRLELDKLREKLNTVKDEIMTLFQSRCGKQQPTTVWVGSEASGIGKTTFIGWLTEQLADYTGKSLTTYSRNSAEKYWSGYVWQDIVHMKDFNQSQQNEEHLELIMSYDPSVYQLPMPDVDQKGRQFRSRFLFIDSNQLFIRRSVLITDGSKLDRRRDFLFEAFTDYVPVDTKLRPSTREEAIKHLILRELQPIGFNVEDDPEFSKLQKPRKQAYQWYTFDGRVIKRGTADVQTLPFSVIVERVAKHEEESRRQFRDHCIQERKKDLIRNSVLVSESTEPAVGVLVSNMTPVIILVGPPGCGKTTLAKAYRKVEDPTQDDFTTKLSPEANRKRILDSYDSGDELLILTTNYNDLELWKNTMTEEQWEAVNRRVIFIYGKFNRKRGLLSMLSYYTAADVIASPSEYSRMVSWRINNECVPYVDVMAYIERKAVSVTSNNMTYKEAPRVKINLDLVENLVEINKKWIDVDEVRREHLSFTRHKFTWTEVYMAFKTIIGEVFANYTKGQNLERGIVQLNSLRVTSPIEFDCVVKLIDEVIFLTTDQDQKLVFCICDDSFDYRLEDDKVMCYSNGTCRWEAQGRVALWYKRILRNVEKITIDYTAFTPPSRSFYTYCDYMLDFLKTSLASVAIIAPQLKSELSSEVFSLYGQDMSRPRDVGQFVMKTETSASAYDMGKGKHIDKAQHYPSKWKVSKGYEREHYDLNSESAVDSTARAVERIAMQQNYSIVNENGEHQAFGQGVYLDFMITVGHLITGKKLFVVIDGNYHDFNVASIDTSRDLAILHVANLTNKFRDIRKHFQTTGIGKSLNGYPAILTVWNEGRRSYVEKAIILQEEREHDTSTGPHNGLTYKVNAYFHQAPIQTEGGDCGSPLLIVNAQHQHKILGLHIAANTSRGLSSIVYQSDFDLIVSEVMSSHTVDVLPFQQIVPTQSEMPEGLSSNFEMVGVAGYEDAEGKIHYNKSANSVQTQIWPSPFRTKEMNMEPSVLSEKDERCKDKTNLIIKGANKYAEGTSIIDLNILDECFEEVALELVSIIKTTGLRTKVLTDIEVINGCNLYPTSGPLNFTSSPGYPHTHQLGMKQKQKIHMFKYDDEKGYYYYSDSVQGQELKNNCETFLSYLKKTSAGQCGVVFTTSKKDEVLKLSKIESGKTRVFQASPTYYSMVFKKYFHAAQAQMTLTFDRSPYKIGIDGASYEWERFYKYLSRTGNMGVSLDYSGYDTCLPSAYTARMASVYNKVYRETDPQWTEEDDHVRKRLYDQEVHPLMLIDGCIVRCPKGNMSGSPDTGPRNNLANRVNTRYAWKVLSKKYAPDLYYKIDTYITEANYGDDKIIIIHKDVQDWFTIERIQEVLVAVGFKMTSSDKEAEMKLEPIESLSFLKRKFTRVTVDMGGIPGEYITGALDDSCFEKMLNWCKTTKRHFFRRDDPVQFDHSTIALTALTCLFEASLRGEEFYNEIKKHIEVCAEYYSIVLPLLPTFKAAFFQTYFKTKTPEELVVEYHEVKLGHQYHILTRKDFFYNKIKFSSFYECYCYVKHREHHDEQRSKMLLGLSNEELRRVDTSYVENSQFTTRKEKYIFKIMKACFGDVEELQGNGAYRLWFDDTYLGVITHNCGQNVYGKVLTQISKCYKTPMAKNKNLLSEKKNRRSTFENLVRRETKLREKYGDNYKLRPLLLTKFHQLASNGVNGE
jgi:guanylate kinase